MNEQPPPSKRARVDPCAMDDDVLPPKGTSVLGKRKRNENNEYYYNNNGAKPIEKAAPPNHPQGANEFMNPEQKDDEANNMMDDSPHIPRVCDFQKGHQLDIKITDEHHETYWTTGIICKVNNDKVLIHVPRTGASWKDKESEDIAPAGTYTDGLN
eukprot:730779_1